LSLTICKKSFIDAHLTPCPIRPQSRLKKVFLKTSQSLYHPTLTPSTALKRNHIGRTFCRRIPLIALNNMQKDFFRCTPYSAPYKAPKSPEKRFFKTSQLSNNPPLTPSDAPKRSHIGRTFVGAYYSSPFTKYKKSFIAAPLTPRPTSPISHPKNVFSKLHNLQTVKL